MKRIGLVLTFVVLTGLVGSQVYGDLTSNSVGKVLVIVNPNVKVDIPVNPGPVNHQTGDVSVTLTFRVDANQQMVSLFVEASDLWKGDDPTNPSGVAPIPLQTNKPAVIQPQYGNPINQGTNEASWLGAGAAIGNFLTQLSQTIKFESSQNNHFSQDVSVKVTWNQNDPEKPQGQYGGRVRLTALLM